MLCMPENRKRHFSIYFVLLIFVGGLVILPLCFGLTWLGMDLQKRIDTNTLESNETFRKLQMQVGQL